MHITSGMFTPILPDPPEIVQSRENDESPLHLIRRRSYRRILNAKLFSKTSLLSPAQQFTTI